MTGEHNSNKQPFWTIYGYNAAPMLIFLSATLWASDALFRPYVSRRMPSEHVVWWEHVICIVPLAPIIWKYVFRVTKTFTWRIWLSLFTIGFGADALANVLLTKGYAKGHVALVSLLQQSQPLFGLLFAWWILGEPIRGRAAIPLTAGALFGLLLMMSPTVREAMSTTGFAADGLVAGMYGLIAAALWALETVLSRFVMEYSKPELESLEVLIYRQLVGLGCLTVWMYGTSVGPVCSVVGSECIVQDVVPDRTELFCLAMMAGIELFSLLGYMIGLQDCPASVASILELAHPLWVMTLVPPLLHIFDPESVFIPLAVEQYVGAAILAVCAGGLGLHATFMEQEEEKRKKQRPDTDREMLVSSPAATQGPDLF